MKSNLASRREFLQNLASAGISLGFVSQFAQSSFADEPVVQPDGKRLVVRQSEPFNAEGPLEKLSANWITPFESFYVRSHGATPRLAADFQVSVEGLVDRPMKASVPEMSDRFPKTQAAATLTCAGNRRNEFAGPKISGVQWGAGAIGNAEWSGVSLAAVLKHAGVQAGAKHVWFEGADVIVDKSDSYPFGGSVPLDKVLLADERHPRTLLATHMNGQPLTAEHGAPIRTIVPGYIGARSVKWLKRIVVSDRPSPNHFLAHNYKLIADQSEATIAAADPIYEIAINSVICSPAADAAVTAGTLPVQGFALPGGKEGSTVKSVELSTDGGTSWVAAKLKSPVKELCWVLWSAELAVTARTERIIVRTTDSTGLMQPRETAWNAKGYQYNAWHQVRLSGKN
jgi:sulfite oxidase